MIHLLRLNAVALLVLLAACSSTSIEPATDQLALWTKELRDQQPDGAVASVYRAKQAQLIFVAAEHENRTESATFRMIEDAFANFDIDVVIVEGYPASKGRNPPRLMDYALEEAIDGFQEGGESVPTIKGAIREKAQVWGGEPDDYEIKAQLITRGFSAEDVLGYYVLRVIPQWLREQKIEHAGDPRLEKLVDEQLKYSRAALRLEESVMPSFSDWARWYRKLNGKPIDADFTTEEAGPLQNGPFASNQISAEISRARDAFLHEQVISFLRSGKTVLVVFGGSHLMIQRPALNAALGKPCYAGPDLMESKRHC
jgi:hypothetical protein